MSALRLPDDEVARRLRSLFTERYAEQERLELKRITDSPRRYKLTRVMGRLADGRSAPTSYRYVSAGTNGRGREVRFCWSCHRNAANYFLGWREVVYRQETRRAGWAARRKKKGVEELARGRAEAFKAARQKKRAGIEG